MTESSAAASSGALADPAYREAVVDLLGAIAYGEGDFVVVLFNLGLVTWGLLFLVANIWTTNDNTAYNVGVAGAELFNGVFSRCTSSAPTLAVPMSLEKLRPYSLA